MSQQPNGKPAAALIAQASQRMKLAALAMGACWWLVTAMGVWLLLFVLDNFFGLPAGLRLPLAIGSLLVSALGFAKRIWKPATQQFRPERVAVALESRYQVPENLLINAYQFETQTLRPEERVFIDRLLMRSEQAIGQVRLRDLWEGRRLTGWAVAAFVIVGAWLAYLIFFPAFALNAGKRFMEPLGDVPPASASVLQLTPGGDVTVAEGGALEVSVAVDFKGEPRDSARSVPQIGWQENVDSVGVSRTGGETVTMNSTPKKPWSYTYVFNDVRRPFAFRVFGFETYTRSIHVAVRPLPRIKVAELRLTPPAYTGQKPMMLAGSPGPIAALSGSRLDVSLEVQPAVASVAWAEMVRTSAFQLVGSKWQASMVITTAGPYEVLGDAMTLAHGAIRLETDNPPEVDFITDDRNRLATIGTTIKLEIQAKDDFGVCAVQISERSAEQESAPTILKKWTYLGPPGNPGPLKETYNLVVDPQHFAAGNTYLLEAVAGDFCPNGQTGKSRPIVLRVRSATDVTLASDDPLSDGFESLKRAVLRQELANGLTANLRAHIDEAVEKKDLARHQTSLRDRQTQAREQGENALAAFRRVADGKNYAVTLAPLVEGEMPWALGDIGKISEAKREALEPLLGGIQKRQEYILNALLSLLGQIAEARRDKPPAEKVVKAEKNPPQVTADNLMNDLHDDLAKFVREQEKILDRSKTLLDKRPEDLTKDEEKILGDLAREEAGWSKYFEEKLTDFAKLPQQDFADASLAKELDAVYQEIDKAAKELYEKKVDMAVPQEQSGLENAKSIEQNLERWLSNKPDNTKWSMEEPPTPADIALAELPATLEDIVGELLDQENKMDDSVEDVTSSWLDSLDKGIGWDAMDGPISDMSAKGITGNLLPNQMEISGRSGEGRNGRSSGQMVGDTAEGKGGRETPTRLSPTPYEQGSVKDSDTKSQGGATGGGKLSGFSGEGLRGPPPPPSNQNAPRLAAQQAKIRQQAEALALKLRQYKLPSGDLEASVQSMHHLEDALKQKDGVGVRRAFSRAVDALQDARQSVKAEASLTRERSKLPAWMRDEITTGLQDGTPRGYEEMTAAYFQSLAEQKSK